MQKGRVAPGPQKAPFSAWSKLNLVNHPPVQQAWGTGAVSHPLKRCQPRTRACAFNGAGGDKLASEFSAHLNQLSLKAPLQHRRPSPLDPPTAAVAAQLDALQINDWPEPDAGVQTALAFAKPYECEQLSAAVPTYSANGISSGVMINLPNSIGSRSDSVSSDSAITRVRSWGAQEQWLTPQEFSHLVHSPPYNVLLGCDSWRACSGMVFPATRVGQRAVQAVEVLASPQQHSSNGGSINSRESSHGRDAGGSYMQLQKYTFTFCLELITTGPYKGCWMTVGVRPGNYSV